MFSSTNKHPKPSDGCQEQKAPTTRNDIARLRRGARPVKGFSPEASDEEVKDIQSLAGELREK